jgi:hypothetical protein
MVYPMYELGWNPPYIEHIEQETPIQTIEGFEEIKLKQYGRLPRLLNVM